MQTEAKISKENGNCHPLAEMLGYFIEFLNTAYCTNSVVSFLQAYIGRNGWRIPDAEVGKDSNLRDTNEYHPSDADWSKVLSNSKRYEKLYADWLSLSMRLGFPRFVRELQDKQTDILGEKNDDTMPRLHYGLYTH